MIDTLVSTVRARQAAEQTTSETPVVSLSAAAALSIGTAFLEGCGGGKRSSDEETSEPSSTPPVTKPAKYRFTAPASSAEASRFLGQATMGPNRAAVDALGRRTYSDWIEDQVIATPLSGYYAWAAGPTGAVALSGQGELVISGAPWRKMIASPDALRQRIVHALAEIFVVYVTDGPHIFIYLDFLDRLQAEAFGNFRTILEKVTLSQAMGRTLTYMGNVKEDPTTGSEPDENFAREVMQLFTLGLYQLNTDGSLKKGTDGQPVATYGIDDVRGLARVFTGWNRDTSALPATALSTDIDLRDMVQQPTKHEPGEKKFLGVTIPAGTDGVASLKIALDTLFNHPNVGPFIGRQLIQRMVTSNPSAAYIGRVAAAFNDDGNGVRGNMKAVVSALLLDDEARDPANALSTTFGRLREPMMRFVNWGRAWNATSANGWWGHDANHQFFTKPATSLGQQPLQSPSVFNFFRPSYVPPTTMIATAGLVAPEFQIANEVTVAAWLNTLGPFISNATYVDIRSDYSSLLTLATDAAALLAEINLVLAADQVSAPTLATFVTAVSTIPSMTDGDKANRITAAVTLVMASPEYLIQK